jgi:tRNA(adenine34) deaminase
VDNNDILENDSTYMDVAMEEARIAEALDEVPIGACIVLNGKVIARAHNTREGSKCATHHAEILAIEEACRVMGGWRLPGTTLYVTLEPCPMCTGAIMNARIKIVIFEAYDSKMGCMDSVLHLCDYPFNHKVEIYGGIMEDECLNILQNFFKKMREND